MRLFCCIIISQGSQGISDLGTLTLLARSSVFYTLAQEDGVDRCFHTFSLRCFPACLSPQQRDTRSLSAFQKRIYGNWAKKLRTYVPTNPLGRVIYKWFCRGFAYRQLSRSALGRSPPPSAVFKIIVMGIKKKIEPISDLENLVRIILIWCGKQDWILTARRRSVSAALRPHCGLIHYGFFKSCFCFGIFLE